jgi:hypothetical protein
VVALLGERRSLLSVSQIPSNAILRKSDSHKLVDRFEIGGIVSSKVHVGHSPVIVGYARTSSLSQVAGLEAQVRELKAAGCEKICSEQVSSVAERAELEQAIDYVREGDSSPYVGSTDLRGRSPICFISLPASKPRRSGFAYCRSPAISRSTHQPARAD